jgi:hypothetical protein
MALLAFRKPAKSLSYVPDHHWPTFPAPELAYFLAGRNTREETTPLGYTWMHSGTGRRDGNVVTLCSYACLKVPPGSSWSLWN